MKNKELIFGMVIGGAITAVVMHVSQSKNESKSNAIGMKSTSVTSAGFPCCLRYYNGECTKWGRSKNGRCPVAEYDYGILHGNN